MASICYEFKIFEVRGAIFLPDVLVFGVALCNAYVSGKIIRKLYIGYIF